jgi:hypothetical protein
LIRQGRSLSAKTPASPINPNPIPQRSSSSRRVNVGIVVWWDGEFCDIDDLPRLWLNDAAQERGDVHSPR